jgi:hypothetical protein
MFCKTYSGDLERFKLLLASFHKYNQDNIFLYVSVGEKDFPAFEKLSSNNVKIISDESYARDYFPNESFHNLSLGYINQEICKLSFWESSLADNYLCLDADCLFIRDFYVSDFMADKNTPYTVLTMDKDLSIEKHYQKFWARRQSFIQKIYDEASLDDRRLRTCHGMQVLNIKVLKSLKEDFMQNKGLTYADLIKIAPYEFTWYNVWFQKCNLVKEYAVEPFFKTFHMRIDYNFSRLKLLKEDDLARAYVGIVLNSNWGNKKLPVKYKKPNFVFKIIYTCLKKLKW